MTLVPESTQLLQAILKKDVERVEELLLNSDTKNKLISEYTQENGSIHLIELLPYFKSKGLVSNIKILLDL